ncbi:MAG: dTDP-4-dehydrorhamnose reductase [Vulcanimicrobiaceae bacterium]
MLRTTAAREVCYGQAKWAPMDSSSRVLVFGGSGQVGAELVRLWNDLEVAAPPRSEVDVEDAASVAAALDSVRPDVVVNCTAFHNVEQCDLEPERAFAVNAVAVSRMARLCAERGAAFVTFSTDYVFDGELGRPYLESDEPNPVNVYGVSKLAGEKLVLLQQAKHYVVRTCGVYGTRISSSKGYTFIDRILAQARAGEVLRIVRDQTVSPSFAGDIAHGVRALLERGNPGLYHVVNEGAVSWYDFATEALRQAGIDHPIEPVSSREWASAVRRPAYSALATAGLKTLGIEMPSWREGIAAYLREKAAAATQ